jgi:nucleoside diphosphate kinase
MIPILLLLGAVVVGLTVFWKQLVEWMKRIVQKLKEVLKVPIEGMKTFITRTKDGLKNIAKSYSKNKITGEFEETITRKAVNESDVPAEIRAKISGTFDIEIDTTEELLAQLQH